MKKSDGGIKIIVLLMILPMLVGVAFAFGNEAPADVIRGIDGDTLIVSVNGSEERVRLIGVNTPELRPAQPGAVEAAEYARGFAGARVWLEFDVEARDKYGRALAYVWLHPPGARGKIPIVESMLNARILVEGLGVAARVPPNVKYSKLFKFLENYAMESKNGPRKE